MDTRIHYSAFISLLLTLAIPFNSTRCYLMTEDELNVLSMGLLLRTYHRFAWCSVRVIYLSKMRSNWISLLIYYFPQSVFSHHHRHLIHLRLRMIVMLTMLMMVLVCAAKPLPRTNASPKWKWIEREYTSEWEIISRTKSMARSEQSAQFWSWCIWICIESNCMADAASRKSTKHCDEGIWRNYNN